MTFAKRHLLFSWHSVALYSALAVLAISIAVGEMLLQSRLQEELSQRQTLTIAYAGRLRSALEREINALVGYNSGLKAYLIARNKKIDPKDLMAILAEIHQSTKFIRNFGISQGFTIRYVYPLDGNSQAMGTSYKSLTNQWPLVEHIAKTGQPALTGPLELVQGGKGMPYRVPIYVDQQFWGILTAVIDSDAMLQSIQQLMADKHFSYAIQSKNTIEAATTPVWGDQRLFAMPEAFIERISVPGGQWTVGVIYHTVDTDNVIRLQIRTISLALGLLLACTLYLLIQNRTQFAERAMYDTLTQLPNRRLFEQHAKQVFGRMRSSKDKQCAVLFLDLDDFKSINDKHSHRAGDAVLSTIAARARRTVRAHDMVARWGGDEFIVLLENASPQAIDTVAENLRHAIQQPIYYHGLSLAVGLSVGVALYPQQGKTLDELLQAADQKMYANKTTRKTAG